VKGAVFVVYVAVGTPRDPEKTRTSATLPVKEEPDVTWNCEVTPIQAAAEDIVRATQLNPSVDEAAAVVPEATATKTPVVGLTVTAYQLPLEGKVRAIQKNPSVDEAALVPPEATATKIPVVWLQVTGCQFVLVGKVRATQLNPSVDEAATVPP